MGEMRANPAELNMGASQHIGYGQTSPPTPEKKKERRNEQMLASLWRPCKCQPKGGTNTIFQNYSHDCGETALGWLHVLLRYNKWPSMRLGAWVNPGCPFLLQRSEISAMTYHSKEATNLVSLSLPTPKSRACHMPNRPTLFGGYHLFVVFSGKPTRKTEAILRVPTQKASQP